MFRYTSLVPSQILSPFAAARASRRLPWGWRVWTFALVTLLTFHFAPDAIALLAFGGMLIGWRGLHRYASSYSAHGCVNPWRQNSLLFGAGLLASLAYMTAGLFALEWRLQESEAGFAILILVASTLGIWLVHRVMRHWWEAGFSLVAGLAVPTVACVALWSAASQALPDPVATHWINIFSRILAVLLVVGAVWMTCQRRLLARMQSLRWLPAMFESVLFSAIIATLIPLSPEKASFGNIRGVALITMVSAMSAIALVRGRFLITKDAAWLRRALAGSRQFSEPVPIGMFCSFAVLPALLMAPLADNMSWLAVFGLCVGAIVLKRLASRPRRSQRRYPRATKLVVPKSLSV